MNEKTAPSVELTDEQIESIYLDYRDQLFNIPLSRAIIAADRALRQSDAQAALAAKDSILDAKCAERDALKAESIKTESTTARLRMDYGSMAQRLTEMVRMCGGYQDQVVTLVAERDALRKDAERWGVWRDSLSEQSQDFSKEPELFRLLVSLPDSTYGPRTPAQVEADTDAAIAAMTKDAKRD